MNPIVNWYLRQLTSNPIPGTNSREVKMRYETVMTCRVDCDDKDQLLEMTWDSGLSGMSKWKKSPVSSMTTPRYLKLLLRRLKRCRLQLIIFQIHAVLR
jgi:hypothetical protein